MPPWAPRACHGSGYVHDIGWDEQWQCDGCSLMHQRDDNAAVTLARYKEPVSVVGPVGEQPRDGVRVGRPLTITHSQRYRRRGHGVGEPPVLLVADAQRCTGQPEVSTPMTASAVGP